jgi:hypothetical protein
MRGLRLNWSLCGVLSTAALLLVAGCTSTDCSAIDPQPPGWSGDPEDNDTSPPGSTYLQVKASTYGPSGGGLFIQVDVAEPDEGMAYNNHANITVWAGSGDDTTGEAPGLSAIPPYDERKLNSSDGFNLTEPRNWGGGTVLDLANSDTKGWVLIEVALHRVDGSTPDKKYYNYTFGVSPIEDLPSGWQDGHPLN